MLFIFGYKITKDNIELVLFCFSAIFALLGGLVGFFVKRWHIRYEAKVKTGNELKEAFSKIKESAVYDFLMHDFLYDLYDAEIPIQEVAYIKFSSHLSDRRRNKFRKAWDDYRRENKNSFIMEYMFPEYGTEEDEIENPKIRKRLLDRINRILKFANIR